MQFLLFLRKQFVFLENTETAQQLIAGLILIKFFFCD